MLGGILVYFSYLRTLSEQLAENRPPLIRPVGSLTVADHRGRELDLFTKGETLYLVGYIFTGQPEDAKKVCERLKALRAPFEDESRIRLVAVSMSPDIDTAKALKDFADANGYTGDEWVFLSGPREQTRKFMNKHFRYPGQALPEEERRKPGDLHKPEVRISLVDNDGVIRGIFWEGEAAGELRNDSAALEVIQYLINDMDGVENAVPEG
mgnify:CR=1 FL=1